MSRVESSATRSFKLVSPSKFIVLMKARPSSVEAEIKTRSAGKDSLSVTLSISPTLTSENAFSSNYYEEASNT